MAKKPLDITSVLAAMRQSPGRGLGRKSKIYRWMEARYDALSDAFAKEPPSWTGLARYLSEEGFLGTDGLAPTPAAVRSTWLRVETSMKRRRQRQNEPTENQLAPSEAPPVPPQVRDAMPPSEPASVPAMEEDELVREEKDRRRFAFLKPKE